MRRLLLACVALAGCSWHYVVVPERSNNGPGFQCALERKHCLGQRGVYGTYVCQQLYYVCLKNLPGAVTFEVRGKRDASQCERAEIGPLRRCATQEY